MASHPHYLDPGTPLRAAVDTDLTDNVRLGEINMVLEAELGQVGTSGIWIDDPTAVFDFVDWKKFYLVEDSCRAQATLTGTVSKSAGSTTITGSGTSFTTQLIVGDEVILPGGTATEYVFVASITSNTAFEAMNAPLYSASGQTGVRGRRQRPFFGYTGAQQISRGTTRQGGGEDNEPGGRDWSLNLYDLNTYLTFRVFRDDGDPDHNPKRPQETPGARLAWMLALPFFSATLFDEGQVDYPTTPLLDAADYTDKRPSDLMMDLSDFCKRNHGIYFHDATGHFALYFRQTTSEFYRVPFRVSNDRADIDLVTTWPTFVDATLRRDGTRIYAAELRRYASGEVYRTRDATSYEFGWRDATASNAAIKTATLANTAADQDLLAMSTQDKRLPLTVRLPAANLNDVREFQSFQVKQTHLPGLEDFTWVRVLNRQFKHALDDKGQPVPWAYDVTMEVTPLPALCTGALATGFYGPICVTGTIVGVGAVTGPDGLVVYSKPGDGYTFSFTPTPGFSGGWHFPLYNQASSFSPSGKQDMWGTRASNFVHIVTSGGGTATIYICDMTGDPATTAAVQLLHPDPATGLPVLDWALDGITANTAVTVTVPGPESGFCAHMITCGDGSGFTGGGKIGFGGFDWVAD